MKKWLMIVCSIVMVAVPFGAAMAGSKDPAPQSGQAVAQEEGVVSQAWIDYVTKREEKKKQRDEKEKIRTKNVQKDNWDNDKLFRSSK